MILIVGGLGSMGRRYQAILRSLGEKFILHEENSSAPLDSLKFNRAIIASPTHTHMAYCKQFIQKKIPFLCEKPLTFFPKDTKAVLHQWKMLNTEAYVVNNYSFLRSQQGYERDPHKLSYNFFNTGKDGLIWDTCQLLYLSKLMKCELEMHTHSPTWEFHWGNDRVPYNEIELSYVHMVEEFLSGKSTKLWDFEMGVEMTNLCFDLEEQLKVLGYEGHLTKGKGYEGFNWNPSTERLVPFAWEDLPDRRSKNALAVDLSSRPRSRKNGASIEDRVPDVRART